MAKLHAMDTREYRDYNYLKTAQDSICQQVKEITSAFHTIQRSLIDIKCYNQPEEQINEFGLAQQNVAQGRLISSTAREAPRPIDEKVSNDDDIIIKIKGIVLTRKEIHTLTIKYDYDSFNKCLDDKVFLPMRVQTHWFLVVVNAYLRTVQVEGLHCYLEIIQTDEKVDYHRWKDFNVRTWDIDMLGGLPQQDDRTSSGLFMLKYMEHWNGYRLQKGFTQNLIDEFRSKLAAILVNSVFNEEQTMKGSPEI
ncbi:hypothetical protein SETIT_6G121100v2 [Setaria italica]|uniref:Ubiquitin-like protease family profile domain-containing protein n=1 Tax=Setaria italica TaxID=4555 RepID=K3YL06_SETIT|nr:hypothetical protein SETIT_6G121100v2 [Setaria italica]